MLCHQQCLGCTVKEELEERMGITSYIYQKNGCQTPSDFCGGEIEHHILKIDWLPIELTETHVIIMDWLTTQRKKKILWMVTVTR